MDDFAGMDLVDVIRGGYVVLAASVREPDTYNKNVIREKTMIMAMIAQGIDAD